MADTVPPLIAVKIVYLTPGVTVLPLATCTVASLSVAVPAATVVLPEVDPLMPIM